MKQILIGGLLSLVAFGAWAEPVSQEQTVPLGQVLSENVDVDGLYTPPGTTLLSGSSVRTHQEPALVHLRGGQVVWLDRQTGASFERTPAGETKLSVQRGRMTVRGPVDELLTLAEDESFVLASLAIPDADFGSGEVRTGAEVAPPAIEDAQTNCLPGAPYPVVSARISPAAAVESAEVYFRAGQFFNFYRVAMRRDAGLFKAVLPQPDPDTREVVYYVEVEGLSGESSRTPEFVAEVASEEECERQGGDGLYLGARPPAEFVSTTTGASAEPPGFLLQDAAPAAVAAGGKGSWFGRLGTGAKIGLVAGGAVGLGFLINELDDSDEAPASPVTP